jgi:hypothetical protein
MRGKVEIEDVRKDRQAIVVSEIPYQVNKAGMVERIAELVREKKIEGIADLRDESDRDGYRVVVELKRDVVPEVVLNQLYKFTPLQTNFGANMVAGWRPSAGDEPEDLLTVLSRSARTWCRGGPSSCSARPRSRAYPGRSCHRRGQYRRSHPRHPHVSRSEHRARNPDVARLAGQGHGDDDHADRRSASPGVRRWHCAPVAGAGEGDP